MQTIAIAIAIFLVLCLVLIIVASCLHSASIADDTMERLASHSGWTPNPSAPSDHAAEDRQTVIQSVSVHPVDPVHAP